MTKELYFFSDVELGGGTITDDFASDSLLSEVIKNIAKSKHPVDLVFNGDSFDFLKCPILRKRFTFYLEHITVNVALEKLTYIYESHKTVFEAWKHFLKDKKNKLFFNFGNHDYELLFPEVQDQIKYLLDSQNVFFQEFYNDNKVYAEHGHQNDVYFAYDAKKVFKEINGKKELNIPALFSGFSAYFMDTKEWHPFLERIEDRNNLFKLHKGIKVQMIYLLSRFYFYNLVFSLYKYIARGYLSSYFSIIFFSLKSLLMRSFDVQLKKIMKGLRKVPKNVKLVFYGHVHEKINEYNLRTNKKVIILDTWREEYSFSDNLRFLVPKTKRYAKVEIDKDIKVTLYDLSAKGGKLPFDKVVDDEAKYIKKVFDDRNTYSLKDYEIEETSFTIN